MPGAELAEIQIMVGGLQSDKEIAHLVRAENLIRAVKGLLVNVASSIGW